MQRHWSELPADVLALLRRGCVIPAHPLALDRSRRLDATRQRALARYYIDAGAGGLAVGVHATQFAIREVGLYEPVLELAARTAREWSPRPLLMIAGLSGRTAQACKEAEVALAHGYHAGMLSLAPMKGASVDELIEHCAAVAAVIPLVGFYLQTAVGGIVLPAEFWRRFAAIDNVIAIKMAPFNRYRTLDVVRGVVAAGAEERVTLYTGNDDHIVLDLLAPFAVRRGGDEVQVRIRGGLLGHWSVWTKAAVGQLARIHDAVERGSADAALLALDSRVTDCNSAFFDVAHDFAGCIPGLPRGAAAPGPARRHLVPGPERNPFTGAGRRDRSCLPRARRPVRRRLRRGQPVALARLTARRMDRHHSKLGPYALGVAAHLLLVLAWYLFVRLGKVPKFVMPSPQDTLAALFVPNYDWWANAAVTATEIFGGYALALAVGVLLALLFTWSKTLEALMLPLLVTLNMIPKVALGPLIIVWFKYGVFPNSLMAFAIAVFPILLTTARGLREVEPELLDLVRSLRGSRWQLFTKIQLPGALPYVFAGMKVAAILAVAGAVVGEFLGSDRGLGYLMLQVQVTLDTPAMFMAVILITLLGMLLYGLVLLLERLLVVKDARVMTPGDR